MNSGPLWLVLINGVSYLTSLLRERFLYQHEYGSHALDEIVVLLAVTAIAGNALGIVLSFWWSAGRIRVKTIYLGAFVAFVVASLLAIVSTLAALVIVYLVASSGFLVAAQRSASAGRQFYALIAAVTAPGPTLAIWAIFGVRSATDILLGYAVGALWQGVGAWLIGRNGHVKASESNASLLWPVLYIGAVQLDGVADISVLLLAGRGWASACAFAYSAFGGTSVVLVGPLGAQALAGRLRLDKVRRLFLLAGAVTAAYVGMAPLVLHLAIHGGAVIGAGYRRVLELTLLYAPALPFSIFWQLVTRAGHRDADQWRALAAQAAGLFVVHSLLLVILVSLNAWILVPLSTLGAFAVLAIVSLALPGTRVGSDSPSF